jgi:hypothetical protein
VFLIFGLHTFHRASIGGPAACRFCGQFALQEVREQGTRLTVFFIPLWVFGRRFVMTCAHCGRQAPAGRREAATLAGR